ncbi:MAG TPA: LysR family transcriptional regulator, partial [Tepidiformaceae bacterium]|nr:LysR family transcriptional regulator [Tepidiformaceae bacterium]
MELAQLEAFLQVAHHRSFSRAAEALFLTQPSVTARIQSLERELGERLFERTGRSVTLTDAGTAFIPHAQRALTAVQEGADAIDAVRHGDVGSIRVGASPTIATYILPAILKQFREQRPRVHVHLITGPTEDVVEKLLAGLVHMAICRLSPHPEVESIHLYNDDLVLVVAPSHPFAKRGRVTLQEAGKEPFLFFERTSSYHGLVYSMFLRQGIAPESVMELDSMEAMKHMVEAGLGVAILPVVSVRDEVERGELVQVDIQNMEQPAQREVGVHVLRSRTLAPPARDFLKQLTSEYGIATPA